MSDWPIEDIPDADSLFYRAHRQYYRDGDLTPGVFRDKGEGMSTAWEKYSMAEELRERAKTPEDNAVLELPVSDVRAIEPLAVRHSPQALDRSHTDVLGEKTPEVRVKLLRICRCRIPLGPS